MLKKTIVYKDFNGVERQEEFRFFLSKTDIVRMNSRTEGGIQNKFERIMNKLDVGELVAVVEDIILSSYGEVSDDGTKFVKNKEVSNAFSYTPAYDQLFMELINDPDKLSEFIKNILPKDLQDRIAEENAKGNYKMPNIVAEASKVTDVTPAK